MKTIIKSILLISLFAFNSCVKTESSDSLNLTKDQLLIQKKLGLTLNSTKNSTLDTDSKFIEQEKYVDKKSGEVYTIFKHLSNHNEYIVKKERKNNTVKMIKINTDLDEAHNGSVRYENLLNNNTAVFDYINGHPVINKNKTVERLSICQANSDETIAECIDREVDEFCSDLISTAAYYTNPSIHILIIILCSCEINE